MIFADIETNGLNPTKIWCMVAKDSETKEKKVLQGHNDIRRFWEANRQSVWIFHAGITFDCWWLDRLCGTRFTPSRVVDTFVLSSLYWPKIPGGHSLEVYGERFKFPKLHAWLDGDDWHKEENLPLFVERCHSDVELTEKLFYALQTKMAAVGFSEKSVELEHQVAWVLAKQKRTGWFLNAPKATQLRDHLRGLQAEKEAQIAETFPAKKVYTGAFPIRVKATGEYYAQTLAHLAKPHELIGDTIHTFEFRPFNVGSPVQRMERLLEAGFVPSKKTKKGGPSADESSIREWLSSHDECGTGSYKPVQCSTGDSHIGTIHLEGAQVSLQSPSSSVARQHSSKSVRSVGSTDTDRSVSAIADWLVLAGRGNMVDTWLGCADTSDGRIHGSVFPCGAATRRATHSGPNTANIPTDSSGAPYGRECRELWTVQENSERVVVGWDIKSAQMRLFAHHINNPSVTELYLNGDPHQTNADNAGRSLTRANLKNDYYAFILGAGDLKLGEICGYTGSYARDLGKHIRETLFRTAPGLERAIKDAEGEFRSRGGFLKCIDGGFVRPPTIRHVLAYQIQPDEAIVSKQAVVYIDERASHLDYNQIGWIHDEGQNESYFGDAEELGSIAVQAIRDAGETFNLNVPMDGEFKIGLSWADTH